MERERGGDHALLTHTCALARVRTHTYTPSLPSNPPTHPRTNRSIPGAVRPEGVAQPAGQHQEPHGQGGRAHAGDPRHGKPRPRPRPRPRPNPDPDPDPNLDQVERLAEDLERTLAAVAKAEAKLGTQLQAELLEYTARQEEMLLEPSP